MDAVSAQGGVACGACRRSLRPEDARRQGPNALPRACALSLCHPRSPARAIPQKTIWLILRLRHARGRPHLKFGVK
eukprot:6186313-Pleurochrysis_carterae.AAC.1